MSKNVTFFSCCNTCEDVLDAYRIRKWNMQVDKIEQCKGKYKRTDEDAFKEGCRIQGHLEVNRVSHNKCFPKSLIHDLYIFFRWQAASTLHLAKVSRFVSFTYTTFSSQM